MNPMHKDRVPIEVINERRIATQALRNIQDETQTTTATQRSQRRKDNDTLQNTSILGNNIPNTPTTDQHSQGTVAVDSSISTNDAEMDDSTDLSVKKLNLLHDSHTLPFDECRLIDELLPLQNDVVISELDKLYDQLLFQ